MCLCFARLVDNFQANERILKEISAHGLLTNIQQVVSRTFFIFVIKKKKYVKIKKMKKENWAQSVMAALASERKKLLLEIIE